LFFGNRLDLCLKALRLERDVFVQLVNIFIERDYLKEGCFLKAVEIVVISLFILARGANYWEVEDRFQYSSSTAGKYKNKY